MHKWDQILGSKVKASVKLYHSFYMKIIQLNAGTNKPRHGDFNRNVHHSNTYHLQKWLYFDSISWHQVDDDILPQRPDAAIFNIKIFAPWKLCRNWYNFILSSGSDAGNLCFHCFGMRTIISTNQMHDSIWHAFESMSKINKWNCKVSGHEMKYTPTQCYSIEYNIKMLFFSHAITMP